MCFSSTASYASGVVIGGLGVATIALVRNPRERPFAALPLLFGVHQVLEGVVWQEVEHAAPDAVRTPAVVAWLFVAWFLLPIWVPLSVRAFEPDAARRAWMLRLAAVGAAIGLFLYGSSVHFSTSVIVVGHHLEYELPYHPGWTLGAPYVLATCVPLLLSSHVFVNRFGAAMTVSMGVTVLIAVHQFSSVWCFFAALLSAALFVHYAREHRAGEVERAWIR